MDAADTVAAISYKHGTNTVFMEDRFETGKGIENEIKSFVSSKRQEIHEKQI